MFNDPTSLQRFLWYSVGLHLFLALMLWIEWNPAESVATLPVIQAQLVSMPTHRPPVFVKELLPVEPKTVDPIPAPPKQLPAPAVKNTSPPSPVIPLQAVKPILNITAPKSPEKTLNELANPHLLSAVQEELALEKEVEAQVAREHSEWTALKLQQSQGKIDEIKAKVLQAIGQVWLVPQGINRQLSCELMVHVRPGGSVSSVELIRSSGNELLDRSARSAVFKASPLPVPVAPELFDKFRDFRLTVRPEGIIGSQG